MVSGAGDFAQHSDEARRIWDAVAEWWDAMPDIPPVLVVRMRLTEGPRITTAKRRGLLAVTVSSFLVASGFVAGETFLGKPAKPRAPAAAKAGLAW